MQFTTSRKRVSAWLPVGLLAARPASAVLRVAVRRLRAGSIRGNPYLDRG